MMSSRARGPYMVLRADGHGLLIETPDGEQLLSRDNITKAPSPQDGSSIRQRAREARDAHNARGPEDAPGQDVFERMVDHIWVERAIGPKWEYRVRWFGHCPDGSTWHQQEGIPREHLRRYFGRKKLPLVGLQHYSRLFPDEDSEEDE